MNVKHNINYFKKNNALKIIGITVTALSFVIWMALRWSAYYVLLIGAPLGIVLFFIGTAARSSEADIDECIKRETADIEVDLSADRHYAKRMLEHIPPMTVGGYEYEDGVMLKRARNALLRSSKYKKAVIYVLSDRLYISECCVDLVAGATNRNVIELKFDRVADVSIQRVEKHLTFKKRTFRAVDCRIAVMYDEKSVWTVPANDDVSIDAYVDTVRAVMLENKKARAEGS